MPGSGTMLTSASLPFALETLNEATRISLGGTSVQPSGVFQVSGAWADSGASGAAIVGTDEMFGCPGGRAGLGESVGRAGAACADI